MKTFLLILLVVLVTAISFGQNLPLHPYRKVGDRYYDLRPLYSWIDSVQSRRRNHEEIPLKFEANNRPMKEWFKWFSSEMPLRRLQLDGVLVQYEVDQVLNDGLLVHEEDMVDEKPFFLTNYPGYKNLTDNQKINFLALHAGSYKYTDTQGAVRTVPLYDYGIPVSPEEMSAALYPPPTPEQKADQAKAEQAHRIASQQSIVKFYQPKAEAGEGFAQMRLGEIYFRGEGVETNFALARQWLSAALTNGYPQVTNLLSEIERGSARSK